MTVVAWDGQVLACDRMMTSGGLRQTTRKLFDIEGGAMAFTGSIDSGLALVDWVKNGGEWPACQKTDDWAQALIVKNGKCYGLAQQPFMYEILDPFTSVGSGRDFAIAAMHCGRSAVEAVEVAASYCINCGNGVDWIRLT